MKGKEIGRSAGILMPVFSLPSKYGIGCFSKEAYDFVDFLAEAGQSLWQILPLGPTSYGDSPYQSFSCYAGNPYFIDLDKLIEYGWLEKADIAGADFGSSANSIDYGALYRNRYPILRKAYLKSGIQKDEDFRKFVKKNEYWVKDYALFMALKDANGGASFQTWDDDIRLRKKKAYARAEKAYASEIGFYEFLQFEFEREWKALKKYANKKGISIIGDIPIYVAEDSSDVWANPDLFQMDADRRPVNIAGCPPDAFAVDGQRWGNPVYNWKYHKKTGYAWWISRMKRCKELYDIVRIDHFRGFDEYYSIPHTEETARNGKWVKGPGYSLFKAIKKEVPDLQVIAEDLGFITDSVKQLISDTGFPNMKVLEFAFDGRDAKEKPKAGEKAAGNAYLPCNYNTNCVVYTGTHDNETVRGWLHSIQKPEYAEMKAYIGTDSDDEEVLTEKMVALAMSSVAKYCVIPLQDWLALPNTARINTPSTLGTNWLWRVDGKAFTKKLAKKIAGYTVLYCR